MALFGTIEIGGTKTLVGVGTSPDDLDEPRRIETTTPEETLGAAIDQLGDLDLDAVGVASFGPLELRNGHGDYGHITATPKAGWQSTDIHSRLGEELGVPVGLDTDVNGAALGEWRWGAGRGLRQLVYVTVGTGIGGGAVIDGAALHGLAHPEMGHLAIQRLTDDDFPGLCRFHGDCLEGMASGPALAARFGVPAGDLGGVELSAAVTLVTSYLAQGLTAIVRVLAPQRIIVGGGVAKLSGFFESLRADVAGRLASYPGLSEHGDQSFVSPPGLGDRSGLAGGLVLAERAAN